MAAVHEATAAPAANPYANAPGRDIPERDGMIFAHIAIRADLDRLERALAALDVSQDWQIRQLSVWFRTFHELVHHHHDIEEKIFIPWLSTKVAIPPKIQADHKTLVAMLDQTRDLIRGMNATTSAAARSTGLEKLRALFPTFNREMRLHLQEEEDVLPPLMRNNFTLEEYQSFEKRVIGSQGLSDLAVIGPWFTANMSEADRAAFLGQLPGPLQFTMRKKWAPEFRRHQELVESIYDATIPPAHLAVPVATCWCCA